MAIFLMKVGAVVVGIMNLLVMSPVLDPRASSLLTGIEQSASFHMHSIVIAYILTL